MELFIFSRKIFDAFHVRLIEVDISDQARRLVTVAT